MKKLFALLLCLVMVVSVFAGCGPTANNPNRGGDSTQGTEDKTPATRPTLPDPSEITITIGITDSGMVEDYDTNALTLWLEDTTGYDIEFVKYMGNTNDYKSKLATQMVNNEELPDMLVGFDLGRKYYQDLGEDGYLIDLAPFFEDEELSGEWWKRFEELPEATRNFIKKEIYDDEGQDNIWALPCTDYAEYDTMMNTMFINKTWLEKLGLKNPTNPDELYEVLKAFKTRDPNGNGKADEIPLLGAVGSNWGDPLGWIINMFMYHSSHMWRVDETGRVDLPYFSDEYREALIYVNKLVKEGLMDSSCWGFNAGNLKGMIEADVQTVGIFGHHPTMVFVAEGKGIYNYEPVNYFGYAPVKTGSYEWTSFITEYCEYPEAAWNVYLALCSEEGAFRMRYGEKDVDWVWADPGTKSFLGYDAKIKILNEKVWGGINNQTWGKIVCTMGIGNENEYCQLSEDSSEWTKYKMDLMKTTYDRYMAAVETNPDNVLRWQIVYTVEEDQLIDTARTNVQNLINAARTSFCTGKSSNGKYTNPADDAQWAAYKQQLLDEGYEEWRSMCQAVYDATN